MNVKIHKGTPTKEEFKKINDLILCGHTKGKINKTEWSTDQPPNKYTIVPCCEKIIRTDLVHWLLNEPDSWFKEFGIKAGDLFIDTGEECSAHSVKINYCPFCGKKPEMIKQECEQLTEEENRMRRDKLNAVLKRAETKTNNICATEFEEVEDDEDVCFEDFFETDEFLFYVPEGISENKDNILTITGIDFTLVYDFKTKEYSERQTR